MEIETVKMKIVENLKSSSLNDLSNLYILLGSMCEEYSRMTDGYSLATGDITFEYMPEETRRMIDERQRFFNYRNIVMDCIKHEIERVMENAKKN